MNGDRFPSLMEFHNNIFVNKFDGGPAGTLVQTLACGTAVDTRVC